MRKVAIALGGLFFIACTGVPPVVPSPDEKSMATELQTASPRQRPPLATTSPAPTVTTFGDGQHRVGDAVQSGTYRALGTSDFCYWERVAGPGGTEDELIANSAGRGPRVVTIAATDYGFNSNDCGTWSNQLLPMAGPIEDGVWIVGVDVAPGRYRAEGGPACAWERLAGFGGTSAEVIETATTGDAAVVTIASTDRGFSSSGCGTWNRE